MAIQMRRGAYAEFDPLKMKAGEWAVSTDSDTKKHGNSNETRGIRGV
nr:MAG TPA: major tropism determinant [Caudoviricetes sp.]DAT34484.1 MAG TPA: major tropism determinant [Caudoviricetes sp.]